MSRTNRKLPTRDGRFVPFEQVESDAIEYGEVLRCVARAFEGIVRRDAGRKRQKSVQPLQLVRAVLGNVVPTLGPAQHRYNRDQ